MVGVRTMRDMVYRDEKPSQPSRCPALSNYFFTRGKWESNSCNMKVWRFVWAHIFFFTECEPTYYLGNMHDCWLIITFLIKSNVLPYLWLHIFFNLESFLLYWFLSNLVGNSEKYEPNYNKWLSYKSYKIGDRGWPSL